MLDKTLGNVGQDSGLGYRPIPPERGFIMSCKREDRPDGTFVIRDLCDQDYVHNMKKMVNPLDHVSRVLEMGPFLVHMNHIHLVHRTFGHEEHDLRFENIQHQDHQNFQSAQRLISKKVQQCLQQLVDGSDECRPFAELPGTLVYVRLWCVSC